MALGTLKLRSMARSISPSTPPAAARSASSDTGAEIPISTATRRKRLVSKSMLSVSSSIRACRWFTYRARSPSPAKLRLISSAASRSSFGPSRSAWCGASCRRYRSIRCPTRQSSGGSAAALWSLLSFISRPRSLLRSRPTPIATPQHHDPRMHAQRGVVAKRSTEQHGGELGDAGVGHVAPQRELGGADGEAGEAAEHARAVDHVLLLKYEQENRRERGKEEGELGHALALPLRTDSAMCMAAIPSTKS